MGSEMCIRDSHYPVKWAAEIAPEDDTAIPAYAIEEKYTDAMNMKGKYTLDEMRDQEEWRARQEESDEGWVEHM